MKMRLVFKGGAVVDADVEDVTIERSPIMAGLSRLAWTNPDRRPGVTFARHVNLDELAGVFVVFDGTDAYQAGGGPADDTAEADG